MYNFYDSNGYHKKGWRNAASSRYAKLEQGRILIGEQKEDMVLKELGQFFVFWSHEPIITRDKPLSQSSIDAYDYKLVGEKKLMGKEVFEIEFVCIKLKDRFAGLPSLKYMQGRIFINKEAFAIIRYEQDYLMDYEWKGKHPKKRGHLKERNIIESSRIEVFSKNKDGYFLDYAKVISKQENRNITLDGKEKIRSGKYIDEYHYSNIITQNVKPLKENLFKFNKQTKYNPDFWQQNEVGLNIDKK